MQWKAEYEIGIEPIDSQHRQLVDTISYLEAASEDSQNEEMGRAIKFLVDYANFHFSDEESFMQKQGYPAYEQHKILHKAFVHKLTEVLLTLKEGGTIQLQELVEFLTGWLSNHILEEDRKIRLHVFGQKNRPAIKENAPPAVAETDIAGKLQKLKSLLEKQLISDADFQDREKSFLAQYSSGEAPLDVKMFDQKISFLETLQKDHLITKEDEKEHKTIVFAHIDPEGFLGQVPEVEKKFKYLKSFHENSFINEEMYGRLKAKLLKEI
jgi:hemerythrin